MRWRVREDLADEVHAVPVAGLAYPAVARDIRVVSGVCHLPAVYTALASAQGQTTDCAPQNHR